MKDKDCIKAILTPPQIDKFCKVFGIQQKDIEVNFDGWHKHILTTKDIVFLFPRNPKYKKALQKELDVYDEFTHLNSVPLPKLIKRMKDSEISYYEFGAVTKLQGTAFSKFQTNITLRQVQKFLIHLSRVISIWHNIPTKELPKLLDKPKTSTKKVSIHNWHEIVLNPKRTDEAISFIVELIDKHAKRSKSNDQFFLDKNTKIKWVKTIKEVANLQHVLIHGDVHEDQVLIDSLESMKITGVLDWETAKIDNPVWDFNFGEWGLEIWEWSDSFLQLRRKMWSEYLKERKLTFSTLEGLHLFYTLWEFTWLVKQKKNSEIVITKNNFKKSVKIYIDKLREVTDLIKEK